MQAIKHLVKIPASRELRIQLPEEAAADGEAEVIILFPSASAAAPDLEAEMREAMQDPLFLADLDEVMEDFKYVDAEWKER
jgi:hypothetical protein